MNFSKRDITVFSILLYFTFIGGTFYSQLYFSVGLITQLIVALVLGGWILTGRRAGLPRFRFDWLMMLLIIVMGLSAAQGLSPRFSFTRLWFSAAHILAFFMFIDLFRRKWDASLVRAIFMTSGVVALTGILEFAMWYFGTPLIPRFAQGWANIGGWQHIIPPTIYRLNITLNGATALASYLALLIPIAISLVFTLPRHHKDRSTLIGWIIIAGITEILTFSRVGILALGVSLPTFAAGYLFLEREHFTQISHRLKRVFFQHRINIAGIIIGGSLILFWMQHSFSNRTSSTNFRFTLWKTAWQLFKDNIWFGVGASNFGRAVLQLNDATLPRKQLFSAHNIYLNTAAELGVSGLIVGACLALAIVWLWWQHWQKLDTRTEKIRLLGLGAALVGLAAQLTVDTYSATPNILLILMIMAYIIAGAPTQQSRIKFSGYVVFGFFIIYTGWLISNNVEENRFIKTLGEVVSAKQLAVVQIPDRTAPLQLFNLAYIESVVAMNTHNDAILEQSNEHYRQGLTQEPIFGLNTANLAVQLWHQGQTQSAIDLMAKTVAIEKNPLYFINLGYFYELSDDWDNATAMYGEALYRATWLEDSAFWDDTPARKAHWAKIVSSALSNIPDDDKIAHDLLFVILNTHRNPSAVENITDTLSLESDIRLKNAIANFYLDRQNTQKAMTFLSASPQNAQDYFLRGRLNLQQGKLDSAEKLLKTAVFLRYTPAYALLGEIYQAQGDTEKAIAAYQKSYLPNTLTDNISVILYNRRTTYALSPYFLQIGMGSQLAKPWLALADIYRQNNEIQKTQKIYTSLLKKDPYQSNIRQRLIDLCQNTNCTDIAP